MTQTQYVVTAWFKAANIAMFNQPEKMELLNQEQIQKYAQNQEHHIAIQMEELWISVIL